MRKVLAANAGIVMSLAFGGIPALAQVASERPVDSPVFVSGTQGPCMMTEPGARGTSYGLMWAGAGVREQVLECSLALSDPRVSGPSTVTFNDDCSAAGCIFWGTIVIEGPDGGWDCMFSGTPDPTGQNNGLILEVCAGTSGYIGLTFMAQRVISFSGSADFGDGTSIRGVIYPGSPPPPFSSPASLGE